MRKLLLADEANCQPLERFIELAGETIQRHVHETQGRVDPGYRVNSYLLFHRGDQPSLRMDLKDRATEVGPKLRSSTC
ncbi:hypothetical protein [Pseudoxanthomonas mexicana]|uniref:hypothetical protein n=1 Tax=Pseudoxanthomonas mexicana TaxID=128785 RepID=UPI00398BA1C5